MERRVIIGCDIGKKQDPSCVVVTEQVGDRFICRDLGRLPLKLDYTEVARRIGDTYRRTVSLVSSAQARDEARADLSVDPSMRPPTELRARDRIWVLIDSGGVGEPVVDGIRERAAVAEGHLMGVQITGGTSHNFRLGARDATVSKQFLVSQLKRLTGFEPPRLSLPNTSEARALADELAEFAMTITDTAHPQWGAAQGKHDDMIMALALSTLPGAFPIYRSGSVKYGG